MKRQIINRLIATIMMLSFSSMSFAGGATVPDTVIPAVEELLSRLDLNPNLMKLAQEFQKAQQAVAQDDNGDVYVGEGINIGERYECTIFYAVTDQQPIVAPIGETWYQFDRFGHFFLENIAWKNGPGRIEYYTEVDSFPGDLVGRANDTTYWEAIRVDRFGGLIVEMEAPEIPWVKAILSFLGLGEWIGKVTPDHMRNDGLMVASILGQALGFVLGYAYCPTSNESLNHMHSMMNQMQ